MHAYFRQTCFPLFTCSTKFSTHVHVRTCATANIGDPRTDQSLLISMCSIGGVLISIKPCHVERKRRCGMTHTFMMFQADMTAVLTRRVRQRTDATASCIFATSTRPSLCSVATATAVTSRPVARAQSTTRLSVCASSKSNTRRQTAQLSMT